MDQLDWVWGWSGGVNNISQSEVTRDRAAQDVLMRSGELCWAWAECWWQTISRRLRGKIWNHWTPLNFDLRLKIPVRWDLLCKFTQTATFLSDGSRVLPKISGTGTVIWSCEENNLLFHIVSVLCHTAVNKNLTNQLQCENNSHRVSYAE